MVEFHFHGVKAYVGAEVDVTGDHVCCFIE